MLFDGYDIEIFLVDSLTLSAGEEVVNTLVAHVQVGLLAGDVNFSVASREQCKIIAETDLQ